MPRDRAKALAAEVVVGSRPRSARKLRERIALSRGLWLVSLKKATLASVSSAGDSLDNLPRADLRAAQLEAGRAAARTGSRIPA
jgi:hypothetical protein